MKPLELLREILTRLPAQPNAWIVCTRSELTRKLCHHPNRPGSVTTADLDRLVPMLVAAGLGCEIPRPGKPPAYVFRPVTADEGDARTFELAGLRIKSWGDSCDPAWEEEQDRIRAVGPQGKLPSGYKPLKHLATICSTDRPKNKADVPVPALSPPQTP